jgi:beta-glucosidase
MMGPAGPIAASSEAPATRHTLMQPAPLRMLIAAVAQLSALGSSMAAHPYPFLDPSLPLQARIDDLLPRVSLRQKIDSMQTRHEAGIPGSGIPASPGYIQLPNYTIETYSTSECLHGYCSAPNMTVFAQGITLAASFDAPLLQRVGAAIGLEARAVRNDFEAHRQLPNRTATPNGLACFSPQINIVRDPRWGRAQETYGECEHPTADGPSLRVCVVWVCRSSHHPLQLASSGPFLTATLAYHYVRGMQGGHPRYVQTIASPKHFDAYGGATTRGHRSPTEVSLSWRDWQETFLPQ